MNPADEQVLAALTPFMSDLGAAHVRQAVVKAGCIRNLTDATALSELEMAKRKFSSRSAAGTYAANVRWRGSRQEWLSPDPSGAKARSAIMGTKGAQFEVKPTTASRVKVGDIVSSGSNRVPTKVLDIIPRGDRLEMRVQGLDARKGTPPIVTTTLRPGSEMRLWSVLEVEKAERRSFGSRSEAGQYAAQVRWGRTLQTGVAPVASGKMEEIPGAREIRGLEVDYSETQGRRIKDSKGRLVTWEGEYVQARKAKQDFDDEAERILSSFSDLSPDQKKTLSSSAQRVSRGLTEAANQIGDMRRVNSGLVSPTGVGNRLSSVWRDDAVFQDAAAQMTQASRTAFFGIKNISGLLPPSRVID